MGDIARPRRRVPARERAADDGLEHRDDFEEARAAAAAHVEHLAGDAGRPARQHVSLDDIVDVREVTRLPAVAVHLNRPATKRPHNEARDDRCVL